MAKIDIRVPDIGDIKEAAVIEVLVKPGQTIAAEQSLITIESDKASMEVPSSHAGTVSDIQVKLGDRVSTGTVILTLEVAGDAAVSTEPASSPSAPTPTSQPRPAVAPKVASNSAPSEPTETDCDVLVLGGGPGGYSAAFRAADLGLKVILVERYAELGGRVPERGLHPLQSLVARGRSHGRGQAL